MIWKREFTLEQLNDAMKNSAIEHLGIRISAVGDDWLEAEMPVDCRTTQPIGILHGGISVALAETVGSLGGVLCVGENQTAVGMDINANHLRPVRSGTVTARATPVHIGKTTHVWHIDIRNDQGKLTCVSRITLSVVDLEPYAN